MYYCIVISQCIVLRKFLMLVYLVFVRTYSGHEVFGHFKCKCKLPLTWISHNSYVWLADLSPHQLLFSYFPEPELNLPPKPINKDLEKVVVVPVTYKGRQPPAFPERVFLVKKVNDQGTDLKTNLSILNVSIDPKPGNEGEFAFNISFSPKGPGSYRIFLHDWAGGSPGPTVQVKNSTKPITKIDKSELRFMLCCTCTCICCQLGVIWPSCQIAVVRFGLQSVFDSNDEIERTVVAIWKSWDLSFWRILHRHNFTAISMQHIL